MGYLQGCGYRECAQPKSAHWWFVGKVRKRWLAGRIPRRLPTFDLIAILSTFELSSCLLITGMGALLHFITVTSLPHCLQTSNIHCNALRNWSQYDCMWKHYQQGWMTAMTMAMTSRSEERTNERWSRKLIQNGKLPEVDIRHRILHAICFSAKYIKNLRIY